jgi:hypothetical protein
VPPAVTLPYEFDTSGVVKLILRGVIALLFVLLFGILYSLFISHSLAAVVQLLLIAAIALYFARIYLRNQPGPLGTITADSVVVQPGQVWGIPLAGPAGRFPISYFEAVRVERVPNPSGIPLGTQIQPHERVYLIGKAGTPDILIARTDRDVGRTLGNGLAAALKLPYDEQIAPY